MADPMNPTNPAGGSMSSGNPQGGGQQGGGQPVSSGGAQGAQGQDLSGIMEENVDISALISNAGNQQQQQDFLAKVKIPPHPNTKFDEALFVRLLAGSISLTITEKHKIIQAIPQLSQFQIDELIKIFQEEQQKFMELEKKHAEQIAELEKQNTASPQDLQQKAQEQAKKAKEDEEAEKIRKNLGL